MTLVRMVFCSLWLGLATTAGATPLITSAGPVEVQRMASGLEEPWSIGFLPDGRFVVTERDGRLALFPAQGGRQFGYPACRRLQPSGRAACWMC